MTDIVKRQFWRDAFLIAWKEVLSKAQGPTQLQSPVLAARAAAHADYAEAHRLAREKPCKRCRGEGVVNWTENPQSDRDVTCDACKGTGLEFQPPVVAFEEAPKEAPKLEPPKIGSGG
jgi:hypothetical protein